jgi:sulfate transport system ATP-binding protein
MSIRVEGVTRAFGALKAVDDVSFTVRPGELVALLGPSGGGKSTLLRIIAGLETADAGSVWLDGEEVGHLHARTRRVGFVFQHYALFRHMTVAQNVAFGLDVRAVPAGERDGRVKELLELMGLGGLGHRRPDELSGGQRQRVALARALAPRPRLLLLDEPFAAIDAKVREELRQWLRALHDEVHVTSLFVTHDQQEAFALADRVLVIHQGRLEQAGTPAEILDHPATEFIARFVGDVNVLDGMAGGGEARVGALRVPLPGVAPGGVRLVIRAYDLQFRRSEDGPATVRRLLHLGDRVKVEAQVDGAGILFAQLSRYDPALQGLEPGARVAVDVAHARSYPLTPLEPTTTA